MAEERQILLELEVDKKGAQTALDSTAAQLEINKKELKELNKEYKDGSLTVQEYSKKKLQLTSENKKLKSEQRDLIKTLESEDNSLNALRANLSKLTKERNNTNQATEKGRKRFQELQGQILKTTTAIKAQEQAGGDFRRNVGNYGDAIKQNIPILDQYVNRLQGFQAGLIGIKNGLGATTKGLSGTSKALRIFKIALVSTGVGAIVVALGSLIAALTSTQKGLDTVTKFTRPVSQIFQRLVGVVQDLGLALLNPVKAFNDLKNIVKDFINDPQGSINAAVEGVKNFTNEAIDAGTRIDKLNKEIEKGELDLIERRGKLNRLFEQSREIANDESKSVQERIRASRAAIEAQNELEELRIGLQEKRVELLKLEAEANDTSREDLREIKLAEEEIENARAAASKKRITALTKLNSLLKQQKSITDELAQTERDKANLESFQTEAKKIQTEERISLAKRESMETKTPYVDFAKVAMDSEEMITESKLKQSEVRQDIQKLENEFTLNAAGQLAGALAGVFEENTVAYKAFASIDAAISTYVAINKTLASLPFPANVISAVGIGVQGFANVAKINGLIGGGGGASAGGAGASQSVSQPRIERTQLTGAFDRNQLSGDLNRQQDQTNQISSQIKNMPAPVVKVSDINKVQSNNNQVKVSSSL